MSTPLNKRLVTRDELDAAVSGDYPTAGGFRKWAPGCWYGPPVASTATTSTNASAFRIPTVPVFVPHEVTIDRIYFEITTASPTAECKVGIYGSTANDLPGALILDAGFVDVTATGGKQVTVSQELPPGLVWLALATNDTIGYRAIANAVPGAAGASAGLYASSPRNCHLAYPSLGSWPNLPSNFTSAEFLRYAPFMQVRVA